jgi:hypothetical protein
MTAGSLGRGEPCIIYTASCSAKPDVKSCLREIPRMQVHRRTDLLLLALFLLSCTLRLSLVFVNREANDDHMQVVGLILTTHTLPQKSDCWECFQPKLFHATTAVVLQGMGLKGASQDTQTLVAELLNFIAGALTLGIAGMFIRGLPVRVERIKPYAFALAALNPQLIGISSQATNDAFAILFSTLAVYATYRFFQKPTVGTFIWILTTISLGISAKTNSWVTAIAIALALLTWIWVGKGRRMRALIFFLLFLILVPGLAILNPLNQYLANTRNYGSPVLMNIDRPPLPHFSVITYPRRPGIISVKDGFFTFKFFSLLRNPLNRDLNHNIPTHRTSLWTQLYASANSAHFENFPPSWATSGQEGLWISRGIFILALLPTLIFLVGVIIELLQVLKNFLKWDPAIAQLTACGLSVFVTVGYILFIALYALVYRDFAVMKAVFLFPALLPFSLCFVRGGDWIDQFFSNRAQWAIYVLEAGISALLLLYLLDVATLIQHLTLIRSGS